MIEQDLQARAEEALQQGDPYAACKVYEEAIAAGASGEATRLNYAVLLWRLYEFPRAVAVFQELLTEPQSSPTTARRIAHCYFEVGRFGEAADAMRLSCARTPAPDAETWNTLAWILERNQCLDEAREKAETALNQSPDYSPAVRLLAHIDRRSGNFEQAEERLTSQLERYPGDFDWGLRYELAAVLDRQGKYDSAWNALLLAKQQLANRAARHLDVSHSIRQRQIYVTTSVTDVDLRRWQVDAEDASCEKRHCILTGFPRSGTTLLEQMLATSDFVVDTDESGILSTQFIAPLIWHNPDPTSALIELRGFDGEQLRAGREAYFHMTERYLGSTQGKRLLIEKDPLLIADLPLPLRLFPQTKLLIALRDPRDVILSYFFTMVPLNWNSSPAVDIDQACDFYVDILSHWVWWREKLPWPMLVTRYEDMVSSPADELKRIAQFLDLDWSPKMLDASARSERKAVRTPTYDDITKPIYARAVGRWRNYDRYLARILPKLARLLPALGYDPG